jgi:hypothetical protein
MLIGPAQLNNPIPKRHQTHAFLSIQMLKQSIPIIRSLTRQTLYHCPPPHLGSGAVDLTIDTPGKLLEWGGRLQR